MALLIFVAKLSILDICRGPSYTSGISGTWTNCRKKILQHAQTATREEWKMKSLHGVKVQHQIVQYIKGVQHEKKCNMKILLYKHCNMQMVPYEKKSNMKRAQYGKSATWKNINCHNEIRKKCTRIVHYSAQMGNGPFVDGPLYTAMKKSIF